MADLASGPLDFLVAPLEDLFNFPLDQLKFVFSLLFAYPLAYFYRFLNNPKEKHVYTISVGLFIVVFCFGILGLIHFLTSTLFMYIIFQTFPSNLLPKTSFFFMFAYLSGLHIYRMIYDFLGYKLDATSVIMVLVIKISSLACNYYDGKRKEKESEKILPIHSELAISEFPSLLEYYSYLCYFPTFLSGPAFNYKQYQNWATGKQYEDPTYNPSGATPAFPALEVLKAFGTALALAVVFVFVTGNWDMEIFFVEGKMDHIGMISRYIYLFIGIFGIRCRYYFIWKLAEGAGIASGLGFSGYDKNGNPKYEGLSNIDIWKIESCGSLRDVTTYWNIKTGEWLKNYIYLRQTSKPTERVPSYALYLTNTASAFWHGFYPGYYMAFIFAAFTTDIARQIRSIFRPMVTEGQGKSEKLIYPKYFIYDLIGRFLALSTFNYGFLTFVALSVERSLIGYKNLGFLGHFFAVLFYGILFVYNSFLKKKEKKKEE